MRYRTKFALYKKHFSFEKFYGVPNSVLIGITIGSGRRLVLLKLM
jgi:hypothetical protein